MKFGSILWLGLTILSCVIQSTVTAQSDNLPYIHRIKWSNDGSRLAIVTRKELSIYDQSLNRIASQVFSTNFGFEVPYVSLSPDGTRIFVGNPEERKILDTATLQPLVNLQEADVYHYTPQWNHDGTEIAFRRDDGLATDIYSAVDGVLLRSFSSRFWRFGFFNREGYPEWSPNSDYFVGVIGGDTVIIFDALTGATVYQHQIDDEHILDVSWSPDSTRLALMTFAYVELGSPNSYPAGGSPDRGQRNSVIVIDVVSGSVIWIMTGFRDSIAQLVWSPDGSQLAGTAPFRILYIWDADTGTLIDSYLTAPHALRFLQYSPYGGRLMMGFNLASPVSERDDSTFIPKSTFVQTELDGLIQFVAPAASPDRLQGILAQCAVDPAIAVTGNTMIEAGQYSTFIQWVEQQTGKNIPVICADDLQFVAEAVADK